MHNLWLNLLLLFTFVGAGGLVSCSEEEEQVTPIEKLVNQFSYNGQVTDIQSVVWNRDTNGLYTLYVSPKANVGSIEEVGSDCVKIEVQNITDFQIGSDAFRVQYGNLDITEASQGDASVCQLSLVLNPKEGTFKLQAKIQMKSGDVLNADYEGAARRLMPVVTKNEIDYNGDKTMLGASAWKRDAEGMYTFYIASQEITDTEAIEGNYLKLETKNPTNFDVQKDAFTLTYGDLVFTEKSAQSGYAKFELEVGFNPATAALALRAEIHSESGDVLMAAYAGDAKYLRPAPVQNQIVLNQNAVKIESVVWEVLKDGRYQLYLSPRKGLTTYEELMAENDFLLLETAQVNGAVENDYKVVYNQLSLTPETACIDRELQVTLQDDQLTLQLYALTQAQEEWNVGYQGAAAKIQPMTLSNQWQLNRETAQDIQSAVEWRSRDYTTFYLCHEASVTAPEQLEGTEFIQITVPNPVAEEIDLATAKDVQIVCGNLDSKQAASLTGSLRISKNEMHKSLIVRLDATMGDNRLRADWKGGYAVGYTSTNTLTFTTAEGETLSASLSKIFVNTTSATNSVAFGLKENPATVEELMDRYAVQFNVSDLNQDITLETSKEYSLKVFDYLTYQTFDSSKETMKGALKVWNDGSEKLYFFLDAALDNGIHVVAEWYGDPTAAEAFDLTPVKPFRPNFKITQENGDVTKDEDIIELQVRENPNFQSNVSGATFSAYEFYFVNKYTAGSGVNDASATPVLVVNKDYIGKENIDLTQKAAIFDFQYQAFNASGIASPTDYSGTTDKGSLTVKKEGDNWKITFSVLDFGNWWGWGDPSGTKATFTAEWDGPASAYTGN